MKAFSLGVFWICLNSVAAFSIPTGKRGMLQHARVGPTPTPRVGGDATRPLQAVSIEVATCLLPTCGGYFSREFGVSYAYGAATSLTAWFVLKRKILTATNPSKWVVWHAAAVVFYGIRLSAFLFYRQQKSKRIKEMQKKIEERAESSGSRLSRTPFVLSCAYLYYGLCAPVNLSALMATQSFGNLAVLFKGLVATTWLGFLVAALGDFTKSFVKARKGEDHLVTGGIFRLLRHPNYTGEMIGWTSSGLAGLVAFIVLNRFTQYQPWFYLTSNAMGVVGINFVLLLATRNLERRQSEMYGGQEAYQKWVSKSWAGFALGEKKVNDGEPRHLEVTNEIEESGSGI
eukprot:scaffold1893_cov220-Amphora_coffeaeformis.AAC.7